MKHLVNDRSRLLPLLKYLAIWVILIGLWTPATFATHIVGGTISYKCLGNELYEITLTVRRDCILGAEDAPFDDPAVLGVFGIDGNLQQQLGQNGELLLEFQGDETLNNEITQICYSNQSSICVHITEYVGLITLPQNERGYILSYQRCCRNSSLNNIVDPLNTGMTLFIELMPDAMDLCNSSPRFDLRPDIFICAGDDLSFKGSATDEEGDQLVYSLCTPNAGASRDAPKPAPPSAPPYAEVEWVQGFGIENMIGGDPLVINTATGDLVGKPGLIGQYLVGLCVEEYRDGILLSRTHQEFQYNIVNCNDDQLVADFAVNQTDCGLENILFENRSTKQATYQWFFDYPSTDPALTSQEENPVFSYAAPGRYSIRLVATNPSSNCEAIVDKDITISDGSESEFSSSILSCTSSDELNVRLTDETGLDADERKWEVIVNGSLIEGTSRSIEFTAPKDAQITASLAVNGATGCLIEQSNEVDVNIDVAVDHSYAIESCGEGFVNMSFADESSFGFGLTPNQYNWTFIRPNGQQFTRQGESVDIPLFENEEITIVQEVGFTNGCVATNSKEVNLDLEELAQFETDLQSCTPGSRNMARVTFRPAQSSIPINADIVSREWLVVNGETEFNSTDEEITLDVDFSSPVWVGHTVNYSNGCSANEERKIKLNELFGADVSIQSSIENCDENEVTVRFFNETAQIDNNTAIILQKAWRITTADGEMLTSTNSSIEYTGTVGEEIEVYYLFNANNGCAFEQLKTVVLGADDEALNFTSQITSCDDDRVLVVLTDNRASDRTDWIITINGVETTRSGREITILPNKNDEVFVRLQTETAGNCVIESGKQIVVNPDELVSYSIDQIDCPLGGIELEFVDSSPSIGGAVKESVNWVFQSSNGQTTSATGNSTVQLFAANEIITVMLVIEYSNGCTATLTEDLDLNFANYLDYDVELLSCNGPNQFSLVITADTNVLPPSDPVSGIFWLITNGQTITNEAADVITLDVDMNDPVEISLSVTYGSRCTFTLTEILTVDKILGDGIDNENDVEIRLTPISCEGQDVTVSINNLSDLVLDGGARIISKTWQVTGDGINLNFTGDSETITVPDGTELNIRLTLELDNGCIFIIHEDRIVRPFDEESVNFTQTINSCSGDNVNITLTDNREGISFTSWILNINAQTTLRTGRSINLTFDKDDEVFARLDTGNASGCEDVKGEEVITDPGDLLTYSIDQIDCPLGQIQLQFVDTSPLISGAIKESVSWQFVTSGGQTFSGSGNSTLQTFIANEVIEVILEIQYSNGCLARFSEELDLNFANYLDYDVELLSCNGPNQFSLSLTADTDALPPSEPVSGIFWLINNGASVTNESGDVVSLDVNMDEPVEINLSVSYGNRCTFTLSEILTSDKILGDGIDNENDVAINLVPLSCNGDDISVSINNLSSVVLNGEATIVSKSWIVSGEGINLSGDGDEITLTAPNGTELDIQFTFELSNGCIFIIRETKTVSPFDEDAINFTSDVISCDGDRVNVILTDTRPDSEFSEWIITVNGQTMNRIGRVVNLTLTRDDDVQARLNTAVVSGCEHISGIDVIINPDELLSYTIDQIDCPVNQIELEFADTSPNLGGATKESINWVFQSSDGTTVSADGPTTVQTFTANDIISVMLNVEYSNGCSATLIEELDLNFATYLSYDARLISCNGPNQFTVELTAYTDALPPINPVSELSWLISNGSNTVNESGEVIQFDVDFNDPVNVNLAVTYDNRCTYTLIDILSFDDIFGDGIDNENDVDILIEPQTCDSDEITYTFSNRTTLVLDNTAQVVSKQWKITSTGIGGGAVEPEIVQPNICANEALVSVIGELGNAEQGSNVCVPFNAFNFTNVGSIQTAFNWDPTVLQFTSFNEVGLNNIDTNPAFTSNGELRMVWLVDFTMTEVTVPDFTTLFEICFDVIGETGQSTEVAFTGIQNLAIEVTSGDLEIIDVCLQPASFTVGANQTTHPGAMNMITGEGDEISFTGNVGDDVQVMLTLELDNACVLILNEEFTIEEVAIDFFNDFPGLGSNPGMDGSGDPDGNGNTGDNNNDGNNTGGDGNPGDGLGFDSDAAIVVCNGQPRPLISNPNPDWTYEWSPVTGLIFEADDLSNPTALPDVITTYTVTVTAGECSSTGTITVIPAGQFPFAITDGGTDACNGEVNLSVNQVNGGRVEWSLDPAFGTIFSEGPNLNTTLSSDSQTFYARQIFPGGCVSSVQSYTIQNLSLDITGVQIDPVTNEPSITTCLDGLATLQATTNGVPDDIRWFDVDTGEQIGVGSTIDIDPSAVRNVRAQLDGGNGCVINTEDTALVPFNINDDISIDNSNLPEIFCVGEDTQISLSVTTDDNLQFSWSPDPCIVSGGDTSSPVINASENKDLIVVIANLDTGCTDELTIPIRVSTDDMSFTISGDSDICDDNVNLSASEIEDATVQWSTSEDFDEILAEGNVLNTMQEDINQRYFARQMLAGGCFTTVENFDVTKNDIIIDGLDVDSNTLPFCSEDSTSVVAITNAGNENIMWFDANTDEPIGTGSPLNVDPEVTMVIYGTVVGTSGCTSRTENITLVPFDLSTILDLNLGDTDGIPNGVCAGESTQLNVTNVTMLELIYEWAPGSAIESGGNTASPIINITEDTEFTLRVTNPETGCAVEVLIPIEASDPMAEIFADPSSQIYLGSDADISIDTDAENPTYVWSTGETSPSINVEPTEQTTYTVTITDENGCEVVESITINVMTDCSETGVFLPNAFTPNGDGVNDVLFVRTNSLRDVTLVIFNRWGRQVFQTDSQDIGWNGRWQNDGDELPPDAYGYILTGICFTGEEYTQKGNVSILR